MTYIAPEVKSGLGAEIAIVLTLPPHWASFEDENLRLSPAAGEAPTQVPNTPVSLLHLVLRDKIITSYQSVYSVLPGSRGNLVVKILIVLQRDGDQLDTIELLVEAGILVERGGGECLAAAIDIPSVQQVGGNYMELMTTLLGQQLSTLRKMEEIKGKIYLNLPMFLLTFFINCVTFTVKLSKL